MVGFWDPQVNLGSLKVYKRKREVRAGVSEPKRLHSPAVSPEPALRVEGLPGDPKSLTFSMGSVLY